ncbi:MAG: PAS domain S-box protein [Proteobacteria bacterium]|nr:PAS domain S-box protein [Pseudomonadota bacterium]
MRILVTGHWPTVADLGRLLLEFGYEVATHSDIERALATWAHGDCEVALIAVARSDTQPFAPVTAFRDRRPHAPIVVVSDMAQVEDRVAGLDAGADDYITVPYAESELRARLNAIARHTGLRLPADIRLGPLLMSANDPMITIDGERVEVTPREKALLEMFAISSPNVLEKSAIAKRFSVDEGPASNSAVEILVHRLRRRLTPYGMSIVNLRGVGYRLQFGEAKLPGVPLNEGLEDADPDRWNTRLLEFTNDAIIIWEMQGRGILYWNSAAEQLYGYSRAEALGKITHVLLRTQLAEGVTNLESNLSRYGVWIGELTHTTQAGNRILVEGRLALMSQRNNRWLVMEVNRDITDQKAAESGRREMSQQLEDLRAQREG